MTGRLLKWYKCQRFCECIDISKSVLENERKGDGDPEDEERNRIIKRNNPFNPVDQELAPQIFF